MPRSTRNGQGGGSGGSGTTNPERIYAASGALACNSGGSAVLNWSAATLSDNQGSASGSPVGFSVDGVDHTKLIVANPGLYLCLANILVSSPITVLTNIEALSNFSYILDELQLVPVSTQSVSWTWTTFQDFEAGDAIGMEVDNLGGDNLNIRMNMTFVRLASRT